MTGSDRMHVVIGATGATGRVIVRELAARRTWVRAVNRSGRVPVPEGVEAVAADATDPASMREACRSAAVVYHCAMPTFSRWVELFPPMMEAVIEGVASAGAKLVFADDTWMYGKVEGPMTEDLPHRPVSGKGVLRAWLAEMLLRAHDRGTVRATIGRAGELYGPAVESLLGRNLFGAALKGKKARFIGDPDQPLTPTFVEDFARGLIVLGEREEALGEAWHVPTAEPTTGRRFVRTIFEECGGEAKVGAVGNGVAKALGLLWPVAREGGGDRIPVRDALRRGLRQVRRHLRRRRSYPVSRRNRADDRLVSSQHQNRGGAQTGMIFTPL